jgi:hypothetical protein
LRPSSRLSSRPERPGFFLRACFFEAPGRVVEGSRQALCATGFVTRACPVIITATFIWPLGSARLSSRVKRGTCFSRTRCAANFSFHFNFQLSTLVFRQATPRPFFHLALPRFLRGGAMRFFRSSLVLCFLSAFPLDAYASAQASDTTTQALSSKDRKKREEALHRELSDSFNSWLNEDPSRQEKKLPSLAVRPTKSATSSSSISDTPPLHVRIS